MNPANVSKNIILERFYTALTVEKTIERKLMKEEKQMEEQIEGKMKKKGPSVSTIILVVVLIVGMGILLYPSVSDWWNSMHATQAIAGYSEAVEQLSGQEKEAILKAAYEYNDNLANGVNFNLTDEQFEEYNRVLDITGNGIMGYLQIPVISVNLPTYHTVDEAVLQTAMGHVPGSSLPVGGDRTHCVMSGHRGLPSAKLLSDLDKVREGDIFTFTVLDQTVTYMVDQIRIVLPEETDDLAIVDGKDYFTLVTCTPYGINTHRILVRGHRIENIAGEIVAAAEAVRIPAYIVIPAIGVPLLFISLALMLLYYKIKKPRKSTEELLGELRKQ